MSNKKKAERRDQWAEAVIRLLELTQSGELQWESRRPLEEFKSTPKDEIGPAYQATYNSRKLRIFKRSYLSFGPIISVTQRLIDPPEGLWTTATVLQLSNEEGRGWWEFPHSRTIKDLYEAVSYQVAGAKEFLDDLLRDVPASDS